MKKFNKFMIWFFVALSLYYFWVGVKCCPDKLESLYFMAHGIYVLLWVIFYKLTDSS